MNEKERRLKNVARLVFGKSVPLTAPREEEPAWDSLNHIKLIIAFESEFMVRVPVDRIEGLSSIGELLEFLE